MRWISVACAFACALLMMGAPATAQLIPAKPLVPSGSVPTEACSWTDTSGAQNLCSVQTPLPSAVVTAASTSTALENTPAAGTTILGPFTPQLGRDLRLVIRGTGWAGTIAVGTSKTTEACSTFNPITVAGQTWASFTADANEVVDTPTLDGIVYCVREVITTAGATVTVRQ